MGASQLFVDKEHLNNWIKHQISSNKFKSVTPEKRQLKFILPDGYKGQASLKFVPSNYTNPDTPSPLSDPQFKSEASDLPPKGEKQNWSTDISREKKKSKLELSHKIALAGIVIALIVALFGNNLIGRFSAEAKPKYEFRNPDTVKIARKDTVVQSNEIKSNIINQTNSSNSNAQIGTNNKTK
jgi:hypothetical protein